MTTQQIIEELKRLPVTDVLHVIEAAEALWQDYTADAELTAFSVLDGEEFVHAAG
jgi:hypothetical protein